MNLFGTLSTTSLAVVLLSFALLHGAIHVPFPTPVVLQEFRDAPRHGGAKRRPEAPGALGLCVSFDEESER